MAYKSAKSDAPKMDVYQVVTDKLIEMLEGCKGDNYQIPWNRVGNNLMPRNVVSKKTYRGVNTVLLWLTSEAMGYTSDLWATYKQWADLGAQVRKGEKGTQIVFWKAFTVESQDGDEDSEKKGMIARVYTVFNAMQVDGYALPNTAPKFSNNNEKIERVEQYFANVGSIVRHGGDRAYYRPSGDFIGMPEMNQFKDSVSYYAVRAHEEVHRTGHESRLKREFNNRFGTEAYAFEELVAELGAAFLCAELELSSEPRKDHAQYLASWLKVLRKDKKALISAASMAQKAVDYLNSCQPATVNASLDMAEAA